MLRECLGSVSAQSFQDFEVLVGNDDPSSILEEKDVEFADKKIRIYNHKNNIGEVANLNFLLAQSSGHYFTWLPDDDAYFDTFLESVAIAIDENKHTQVTFSSFFFGDKAPDGLQAYVGKSRSLTGREFLRDYLSETIEANGCYGVYDRDYLINVGGCKQLGTGFGPYADTRLVIISGLLEYVNYIDKKLVFFRNHEGSISASSPDFDAYRTAQCDLIDECIEVFKYKRVIRDFDSNLSQLLWVFLCGHQGVMEKSGKLDVSQLYNHLMFLLRYCRLLRKGRAIQKTRMISSALRYLSRSLVSKQLKYLSRKEP